MHDLIEDICTANGWGFEYGRRDFDNLYDEEMSEDVRVFLDPVTIDEEINEQGVTEHQTYSGSFMMLKSSDVDEKSYEDRYQDYILDLKDTINTTLKNAIICKGMLIKSWKVQEVINVFDFNFDGLLITYSVYD